MFETSIDLDCAAAETEAEFPTVPSAAQLAWLEFHVCLSEYTDQHASEPAVQS